ncbi:hypothetical protein [Shewanella frigidimarina]|uniref:hypothetical protein n=1 Tax=Shewanella frigidimarina TaxID=56812 RepID=UPI003FA05702
MAFVRASQILANYFSPLNEALGLLDMDVTSIKLKSSTADCEEQPKIEWNNFDLSINFKNWNNQEVVLKFFDVPHFKMISSDEIAVTDLSDDSIYEVKNSDLIESLVKCGEITSEEQFQHWFIGFNEIGSFVEVVFRGFSEQ